jgi:hypothetical protein
MTPDQERWAEALAIQRLHGDRAVEFIVKRVATLAAEGDMAGVARWREIVGRLDQLIEAQRVSQ